MTGTSWATGRSGLNKSKPFEPGTHAASRMPPKRCRQQVMPRPTPGHRRRSRQGLRCSRRSPRLRRRISTSPYSRKFARASVCCDLNPRCQTVMQTPFLVGPAVSAAAPESSRKSARSASARRHEIMQFVVFRVAFRPSLGPASSAAGTRAPTIESREIGSRQSGHRASKDAAILRSSSGPVLRDFRDQ